MAGWRMLVAIVLVLPMLGCAPAADDTSLLGNWRLVELGGEPVEASPPVTAVFGPDDRVGGSGGCNHYGGPARVSGDRLAVGPIMSTLMACEPAAVMEREAAYLQALEAAERWEVVADRLVLHDASGSVLVTYERVAG